MKLNPADFKRALSRKRNQTEDGATRPRGVVAKKQRRAITIRSPPREVAEDEVEVPQEPIAAAPISLPSPVIIPSDEDAVAEAARQRKGKAPMTSSAPEEEEAIVRITLEVPKSATAIGCKSLAQQILRTTILPKDWENRKNRSLEENVKSFYSGLAKLITDISIIQDGITNFGDYTKIIRDQMETAKADAEVANELRKAGENREMQLRDELQTIRAQVVRQENRTKELTEKLAAEEEKVKSLQEDLTEEGLLKRKAEERAEVIKKDFEAARLQIAEDALRSFRDSSEYRDEVADNCLEALHMGFEDCKKKVAAAFPDLNLDIIEEGLEDEDAAEEIEADIGLLNVIIDPVAAPEVIVTGDSLENIFADNQENPVISQEEVCDTIL